MKSFLIGGLTTAFMLACHLCVALHPASASEPGSSGSKPNIVLVVADDLGIFDLGCYGRVDHRTPHLDRMAAEGVRFTSGYCALPICSASRAALLTSKSPARLHLTSYLPGRADAPSQRLLNAVMEPALVPSAQTLAEALQREGYATGIFGKWHLGSGESSAGQQGFDVVMEPPGNGDPATTGGKNEFLITEQAIAFLRTPRDQPFFCYVPHHSPHVVLRELDAKVASNAHAWNPLYASTIQSLDESMGQLMAAIDALPDAANTLVIFTSDNGGLHVPELHPEPATHNGPFRAGKGYLYEGGLRVPLIVRWPGRIPENRIIEEPVSLLDIVPTVLQAVGVETAKTIGPVDGQSILGLLEGQRPANAFAERSFFWHLPHYTNQGSRPSGAARRGRWKLVEDYESGAFELYDLENDLSETINVAKEHQEIVSELGRAQREWRSRNVAQECQPNPEFREEFHRPIYVDADSSRIDGRQASAKEIAEGWRGWRQQMDAAVASRRPRLKDTKNGVLLMAAEAKVHGSRLRYEPEPYKNVLGYWTEVDDWADWEFELSQGGNFDVQFHYGCGDGNGGSEIDVLIESAEGMRFVLPWTVRETGHFQNIVIESLGVVKLASGKYRVAVKPKRKSAAAVVDIRCVALLPTP
jgi:arylsulfatase A